MHLVDLQAFVWEWFEARGHDPAALAWRWHPQRTDVDLACGAHAARLAPEQVAELIQDLSSAQTAAPGPEIAITWEAGYFNFRFSELWWRAEVQDWLEDAMDWRATCGTVGPMAADAKRDGLVQRATALADMDCGFSLADLGEDSMDWRLVKELLSAGQGLRRRAPVDERAKTFHAQVIGVIAELWQQPILVPGDPASAWRQACLKLAINLLQNLTDPFAQF